MIYLEFEITQGVIWLIVAVLSGVMEALTLGLTSIWFVFGAIVAWILYEFNAPFIIQLIAFIAVSGVLLYFTKPLVIKYLKVGKEKTNVNALVGEVGLVIVEIDTMNSQGQVDIEGQIWSAKTDEGIIAIGEKVEVLSVQGVKAVVKKV